MTDRHVYLRAITQDERTSLAVLAGFVTAGARVLDLGTGSGALGQHLRDQAGCTVDGVTINAQEAALARPHYRRVEIADLEHPQWVSAFAGEQYDFIVCADVLEHLRQPEAALLACRQLLAPGGRLLISIPNASYSGLVAELMQGDFAYRKEGLLDRTHLRFFTRRSLKRFLGDEGWDIETLETIDRPLTESEFQVSFDQLPPAVSRYLLAVPDAAAYQLIAVARLSPPGAAVPPVDSPSEAAQALFSAQLYLGDETGFHEDKKIIARGVMGVARQVLQFPFSGAGTALTHLRLDPADRPGFLHLYRVSLLAQSEAGSETLWQWQCDTDGLAALDSAPHHDMTLRSPWPASAALILLHGDDPRIQLPIPPPAIAACRVSAEAVLEIEVGWPMSADYMALVEAVAPLHEQINRLDAQARQAAAEAGKRIQEAETRIQQLTTRQQALVEQAQALTQQSKHLGEEKHAANRQKLALQAEMASWVQRYEALATHLRWIENSTVFRMTRPLVHAKMAVERLLGLRPADVPAPVVQARPIQPQVDTVDVIVPVYRGLEDTRRCVQSVLASQCRTPWRLILLNDASPEPDVTQWLREVSQQDSRIVLLENETNLGFVATVNRGMAMSGQHDALLLNSDTEVANDWLDRLRRAAYSDARVASVTPFSNNATICSYPRFCEPNELPPGYDTTRLDALFASTNAGQVIDVPTGVGFCMYIRRDSLRDVGLFDVENFGKGYGEENDFCCRAAEAGWRNLHALDTFVLHTGGVSFGESKSQRERDAVEKLRGLHPRYDGLVHNFVAADPAMAARLGVDLARVRASGLPSVLAVLHNRGGGTLRHAAELASHLRDRAAFFSLSPAPGHAVCLELLEPGAGFKLEFTVPGQWQSLLQALRALGIVHIHYHHFYGHSNEVLGLGEELGLAWDFTAHDFYAMCPQISLTDDTDRYCGEQGDQQCARCHDHVPASGGPDIAAWRERYGGLLAQARHVLVPSRDAARRFARMWPLADVRLAPHTDVPSVAQLPAPVVTPLAQGAPLRVAVIGALSRIKGADLLEDVAKLAARHGQPIEFHLIGFAYRDLVKQPRAALTVHGAYAEQDLPGLLSWLKPDIVWFPALWPETYSYTLSACLLAGLPVVAPNIGAFAERLSGRKWSWVESWDLPPASWLEFFVRAREQHFAAGRSPHPPLFAAVQVDERIKPWAYETEYLRGLQAKPPAALPADFLLEHRAGGARESQAQSKALKRAALSSLVHLRSSKGLRSLARAIPLQWQRRVKSWLQA